MKKENNDQYHTTEIQKKNQKRILRTVICQYIGQPVRNVQFSRNMQPAKTESRKNRQVEQTKH